MVGASAHHQRVAASAAIFLFTLLLISSCGSQATDRILFTSDRDGNQDIYAIDSNGENLTLLTPENSNDFAPQWSPGHKRIVFLSDRFGGDFAHSDGRRRLQPG